MLESNIQKQIITALKRSGWIVDKPAHRSHNGFPDITAYRDHGQTIFIEVKRPGGKTSKVQDYWIYRLEEMGFDVFVVEDVKELKKEGLI